MNNPKLYSCHKNEFVVHLHNKPSKHYDIRLTYKKSKTSDCMLLSFATKKLPELLSGRTKLIRLFPSSDHDYKYKDFEGKNEYGKTEIYDSGTIKYIKLTRRSIVVKFNGKKLKGTYFLTRFDNNNTLDIYSEETTWFMGKTKQRSKNMKESTLLQESLGSALKNYFDYLKYNKGKGTQIASKISYFFRSMASPFSNKPLLNKLSADIDEFVRDIRRGKANDPRTVDHAYDSLDKILQHLVSECSPADATCNKLIEKIALYKKEFQTKVTTYAYSTSRHSKMNNPLIGAICLFGGYMLAKTLMSSSSSDYSSSVETSGSSNVIKVFKNSYDIAFDESQPASTRLLALLAIVLMAAGAAILMYKIYLMIISKTSRR